MNIMFLGTTRAIDQGEIGLAQWALNTLAGTTGCKVPVIVCNSTCYT
jgi:hypothetical protein